MAKSTLRPKFDFSKLVPIKILQQEEWGTTSLASFSAAQRFALKKTGCAKISIKGVPSLTKLQSSVSDQIEALSELTHGKLTAYTYKFVESTAPIQLEQQVEEVDLTNVEGSDAEDIAQAIALSLQDSSIRKNAIAGADSSGKAPPLSEHSSTLPPPSALKAWGVNYSSVRPKIKPSRFLEMAKKEAEVGHFQGLPTVFPFNDDLYWSRVSSAAQKKSPVTYPADINASVLESILDFPKAWNIGCKL